MADGKRVSARDLELTDTLSALLPQTLEDAREKVELDMVQDALCRHRRKITSVAVELGISRPTLYELIEELGTGRDTCWMRLRRRRGVERRIILRLKSSLGRCL